MSWASSRMHSCVRPGRQQPTRVTPGRHRDPRPPALLVSREDCIPLHDLVQLHFPHAHLLVRLASIHHTHPDRLHQTPTPPPLRTPTTTQQPPHPLHPSLPSPLLNVAPFVTCFASTTPAKSRQTRSTKAKQTCLVPLATPRTAISRSKCGRPRKSIWRSCVLCYANTTYDLLCSSQSGPQLVESWVE